MNVCFVIKIKQTCPVWLVLEGLKGFQELPSRRCVTFGQLDIGEIMQVC